MKYATRINSFYDSNTKSVNDILKNLASVEGITHVDLNYPEHFSKDSVKEILKGLNDNNLKLNGIAPRFRNEFIRGEFTNPDPKINRKAIDISKDAVDVCRELGGEVVTIWLGYDGYDYPFQMNYRQAWEKAVAAFQEICDYAGDIKISIEYKPYQPRVFSLISSFGDTMMMINDVKRDNIGLTLDFCHMLMKGENPAFGLDLATKKDKLYGIHINDGNKLNDDGLMVGMINIIQTLEFVYYLKKSNYDNAVFFDTFPIRENPTLECEANVKMINKLISLIDELGMEETQRVINMGDAVQIHKLLLNVFK